MGGDEMILEKLRAIISEQFGVESKSITEDTSFEEDLNADSLDVVELIMAIEEEFDLGSLEDEDVEGFSTVGDVVEFIKARIE